MNVVILTSVLGFGFWVFGFWFWVLGFGFWVWFDARMKPTLNKRMVPTALVRGHSFRRSDKATPIYFIAHPSLTHHSCIKPNLSMPPLAEPRRMGGRVQRGRVLRAQAPTQAAMSRGRGACAGCLCRVLVQSTNFVGICFLAARAPRTAVFVDSWWFQPLESEFQTRRASRCSPRTTGGAFNSFNTYFTTGATRQGVN